jgi:hypothetical protein
MNEDVRIAEEHPTGKGLLLDELCKGMKNE